MKTNYTDYSAEEIEIIAKTNYSKFQKIVIEIKLEDMEYYNNNIKIIDEKYASKALELRKRNEDRINDEIADMKKTIRNINIGIVLLTVLFVSYIVVFAQKLSNSSPFGIIMGWLIIIGVGIYNNIKRHETLNALIESTKNYNASIKSKLNVPAIRLYKQAEECINNKEYKDAIKNLNEALEEDRTVGELYSMRGEVYKILGENEKAEEDYNRAQICGMVK